MTLPSNTNPPDAPADESRRGCPGSPSSAQVFRPLETSKPPVPYEVRNTDTALREAEVLAGVCREYNRLMATGYYSMRTAAAELGCSTSFLSGEDSLYARFQRHGVTGLMPRAIDPQPSALEIPPWFVPAARFFYLLSNRTHCTGSMPEAVRRTISLPNLPFGWTKGMRTRFLAALNSAIRIPHSAIPACSPALREIILARQAAGKPLVPPSVAKRITVNSSVVKFRRSPREWSLANQSAPGSQRRYTNNSGERVIMEAGDWFGGDDATPGIALCVPCKEVITPCSKKFDVLLGRFQWLAYHDARTDKILAWDYVIRPRGSYRAEDILNGMGAVTRTHGIPRQGWQFEGGAWNCKLVCESIRLLGCQHWRTYSPHQKAIESVFNRVWTRLAVQFPHADMGRFRNENEANCKLYENCKAGHKDPRRYFPTLDTVVRVFDDEIAAHNAKLIVSGQYGRWVPDELFAGSVKASPLRRFSPESEWIFSPFMAERTVRGMMVRCRVPMFENFSVPFEFGADWMPLYNGRKVRLHFNPRLPRCLAKIVLLENAGQKKAGDILGDAQLIGETSAHIRYILEWGDDNQRAGYLARQRAANFMRRETRGIGAGGRTEYASSEERDGLATITTIKKFGGDITAGSGDPGTVRPANRDQRTSSDPSVSCDRSGRPESPQPEISTAESRAAKRAETDELVKQNEHLFI